MNARAPSLVYGSSRSLRGGFMKSVFALLLLCAAVPATALASVPVPRHLANPDTPRIEDPDALVERYLAAVDRGELQVFGQKIDRAMIVPVRVEYVYELSDRAMRIKVYSNLNQPLAVPGQPDCQILGVSAVMADGVITEIESHVWLK
jgi:hypothetical protein